MRHIISVQKALDACWNGNLYVRLGDATPVLVKSFDYSECGTFVSVEFNGALMQFCLTREDRLLSREEAERFAESDMEERRRWA